MIIFRSKKYLIKFHEKYHEFISKAILNRIVIDKSLLNTHAKYQSDSSIFKNVCMYSPHFITSKMFYFFTILKVVYFLKFHDGVLLSCSSHLLYEMNKKYLKKYLNSIYKIWRVLVSPARST